MRRLIWGFAGRTYHIVGNLMHWLISWYDDIQVWAFQLVNMMWYASEIIDIDQGISQGQYLKNSGAYPIMYTS